MRQRIDNFRLAEIAASLDGVRPPEKSLTRTDALHLLKPKLLAMQKRGHTPETIGVALSAEGLDCSTRQVAAELRIARAPKTAQRGTRARRDTATANTAAFADQA